MKQDKMMLVKNINSGNKRSGKWISNKTMMKRKITGLVYLSTPQEATINVAQIANHR
jgi:hypothetical protein